MILKSYIIEKNINLISEYNCVLFYGENDGIKDDVKNEVKKTNQDAEFLNFFQEDIIKDETAIFREVDNLSLFSEKKLFSFMKQLIKFLK